MTRAPVVIAASAPPYCELCRGGRAAGLLGPGGARLVVACPHCSPGGAQPLPIVSLPTRQDTPRRTT